MVPIWRDTDPIWLVGCGNMAGAMLARWLQSGLSAAAVTVVRPSGQVPAPGVRTLTAIPAHAPAPRLILLGVKPQRLDDVAYDVARIAGPGTLLLSILAGAEVASLRARFPAAGAIVRAIPNTPVAIGRGAIALHGAAGAFAEPLEALLRPLGRAEWITDESLFDALTALVGSGPAFVFRFIEGLAAAAAELGLSADQALPLARAMVDGAAGLALASTEHPAILADRVASPGGTTRRGLDVLDAEGRLNALLRQTLAAAAARSRELSAATR